jgi:hypothetical protein
MSLERGWVVSMDEEKDSPAVSYYFESSNHYSSSDISLLLGISYLNSNSLITCSKGLKMGIEDGHVDQFCSRRFGDFLWDGIEGRGEGRGRLVPMRILIANIPGRGTLIPKTFA